MSHFMINDINLRCPISRQIFLDPIIADDGKIYERYAIETWLKTHHTSPLTRLPIKNIYPALIIKCIVESYLDTYPEQKVEQFVIPPPITDNLSIHFEQVYLSSKEREAFFQILYDNIMPNGIL